MLLNRHTKELVDDRLTCLTEEQVGWEDWPEWEAIARQLKGVADVPTVEALRASPLAQRELMALLDRDEYRNQSGLGLNAAGKAVTADLCRAGFYDKHDPNAVSTHRPRTMMVDGTKYEV